MKTDTGEKIIVKSLIFWAVILLLFIYANAHAVDAVSKGRSEAPRKSGANPLSDLISGNGSASILESDDFDEAKGKAIAMAKNEAVMKVVGMYVNAEILTKEKENLLKVLKPKQDEIVEKYEIISEERGEDGFYRVKINAKIKEEVILLGQELLDRLSPVMINQEV